MKFAIIENEFGEVGVDDGVLKTVLEEAVVEVTTKLGKPCVLFLICACHPYAGAMLISSESASVFPLKWLLSKL